MNTHILYRKQLFFTGILNRLIICLILLLFTTNSQSQQRTNLPTFYLTTQNAASISDKETWIPGNIKVISSNTSENLNMDMEIRGRGNSTWNLAKKPYRIKLDKKTQLLNLPAKEKNWVLLANHADKALIRNAVAFKISEILDLEFTPSVRFVDVVLNGEFLGNYMLTDQVEVANLRVPVQELNPTDIVLPTMSGGYLLEVDGFADREAVWFYTNRALKITVKYPKDDEIQTQQLNYIKNFTQSFETALFSDNFKDPDTGYRKLVDTTSLINWYIACELTGNPDAFWSTYIYKYRNVDRFYFGPLWDFDIAFNNDNRLGNATLSLMRERAHDPKIWIQRIWSDDWFKSAVNRRWLELINNEQLLEQLLHYVDETTALINESQQQNFNRWKVLNSRVYLEQYLFPTYEQGIEYLKRYLTERVNFLTSSFAQSKPEEPSRPFVAENFYYRITNKGTNNAIEVVDKSLASSANLWMWAPQENNYSQQWRINALGNGQFQIINRNSEMAITGNGRGNNLIQTTSNTSNEAQLWKITAVFTGDIYGLENVKSAYSANNNGGSFANGTPVIEWDNNIFSQEKINQHWYIQKVEPIDDPFSANEIVNNPSLRIYPNPAGEYLNIEYDANGLRFPIDIFSIDGKLLYHTVAGEKQSGLFVIRIKDMNIQSGVYMVRIGDYLEKLIVEH
jgi:hypothetical protein